MLTDVGYWSLVVDGGVRTLVTARAAASLAAAAGAEGRAEGSTCSTCCSSSSSSLGRGLQTVGGVAANLCCGSSGLWCEAQQEGVTYFGCCGNSIGKLEGSYISVSSTLSMGPLPPICELQQ
jgi:hypothetical protein